MSLADDPPIICHGAADPFILPADGAYYLFASHAAGDGRFIQQFASRDLRTWQPLGGLIEPGPTPQSWNRRNFWAPELLADGGRCYLYYTAMPDGTPGNTGNRVGLAVAERPEGPYRDHGVVVPHASLDGSPFRDDDGSLWLLYTAEFGTAERMTPGRIYIDRLLDPTRVAGEPTELVSHHKWQEGPCMLRRGERFYLFYSTGNWGDSTYGVRHATGATPRGPFIEQEGLLLGTEGGLIGPGHHNFFRTFDGQMWIIFHAWSENRELGRMPHIARLEWDGDRPVAVGR